jgi:hypothetical protein
MNTGGPSAFGRGVFPVLGLSPRSAISVSGKVNFLASETHYVDHLMPVYLALPEKFRGEFHVGQYPADPSALTVVSSWGDYLLTSGPVIFFEHGAGFSYIETEHPSYAGGPGRDRVVLFCNPNVYVQDRNVASYPDVPNEIVGSPKMDVVVNRLWTPPKHPAVAYSFHWDSHVVPETRWAFPHYETYFTEMYKGYGVNKTVRWHRLGHGHPRAWDRLSRVWDKAKMRKLRYFSDVLTQATVYVCDTSSTIYEFAATGRPVVVLNAPWYRKHVNHGIRFWDNVPGIQVDHQRDLDTAITEAVFNDSWSAERERISSIIYPHLGSAAQKAAETIVQLVA